MKAGRRIALAAVTLGLALPNGIAWSSAPPTLKSAEVTQGGASEEGVEHASEEHREHARPKPINWFDFGNKKQPPFLAMIINAGILFGVYYFLGRKPIRKALRERRNSIAKEIEEARRIKEEAEVRAKHYQAKLDKLESELESTRHALIDAGKGERERIIKEAEEKAARMQRDAALLIEQELLSVRQALLGEMVSLSVASAEEILKARITKEDHERLAEEFLRDLSSKGRALSPAASRQNQGNVS